MRRCSCVVQLATCAWISLEVHMSWQMSLVLIISVALAILISLNNMIFLLLCSFNTQTLPILMQSNMLYAWSQVRLKRPAPTHRNPSTLEQSSQDISAHPMRPGERLSSTLPFVTTRRIFRAPMSTYSPCQRLLYEIFSFVV